jgi:hypothetical protein
MFLKVLCGMPEMYPPTKIPHHGIWGVHPQYISSRRDDMFRLAEALFMAASAEYRRARSSIKDHGDLKRFKESAHKRFEKTVPPRIRDLYEFALGMSFDKTPAYQKGIEYLENPAPTE